MISSRRHGDRCTVLSMPFTSGMTFLPPCHFLDKTSFGGMFGVIMNQNRLYDTDIPLCRIKANRFRSGSSSNIVQIVLADLLLDS